MGVSLLRYLKKGDGIEMGKWTLVSTEFLDREQQNE
jgi:hypothetical protein